MSTSDVKPDPDARPVHDYLLFGRDPGEAVPTYAHAAKLKASIDHQCERTAKLLQRADAILIGTGAGWSADSGLATYKDIADVPALHKAGLTYYDLCQPHWIRDDPSVFFGFWGYCLDAYRRAKPHEGYEIVRKWASDLSHVHNSFQQVFADAKLPPLFIYSSNVDHHWHKAELFSDNEVYEFHGHAEEWCCSGSAAEGRLRPCCHRVWNIPTDFSFDVDGETLRAESRLDSASEVGGEMSDDKCPFKTAQERGDPNRPRCPSCKSLLRPRVLHFNDGTFLEVEGQRERFRNWQNCVWECMQSCEAPLGDEQMDPAKHVLADDEHLSAGSDDKTKGFCLALLEFGCGLNVPTIRREFEKLLDMYPENCVHVRVNPDFPVIPETAERQHVEAMSNSLTFIKKVDSILTGGAVSIPASGGCKAKAKAHTKVATKAKATTKAKVEAKAK